METWSSTLVESLLRVSWQASILIGLVLIAQWIFGKKLSPAWRYNLWLLVVVRLLLPSSPEASFSIFNATPPLENLAQRLTYLDPRGAAYPDLIAHSSSPPADGSSSVGEFNGETLLTSQPAHFDFDSWAANVPNATLSRFAVWAAALWFIVAALLLFRALFQNALFYRKLALADPITDPTAITLLDACRAELRLRIRPLLIETDLVPAPAVYGIFRPRILLPLGAANTYTHDELRHIFLHELAHIKRIDPAVNCLLGFARIIHWFNPLVWIAAERMRADREVACDALALRHAGDSQRRQYGETILKILNTIQQPRLRPGLVGIIERKHQLERRIIMIAQSQNSSHSWIIATALIVTLAAATLTDAQSSNDVEPTTTLLANGIRSLSSDDHLANANQASQTPPRPISKNLQNTSPSAASGPFHAYTIQAGNTIADVAGAYNEEYRKRGMGSITVSDVLRANPGVNPSRIRVGQVIKIPVPGSPGDDRPVFPGANEPAATTLTGAQSSDEADRAGSISPAAPVMSDPAELFTRTFRLDPAALEASLTAIQPPVPPEIPIHEKLAHLFRVAGVDFLEPIPTPPDSRSLKALYYNDRTGILFVRATLSDLGTIEELLHMLNTTPPQIVIEAKLIEISATDNKALGFDWFLGETTSRELPGGENSTLAKARAELAYRLQMYSEKHPLVLSQSAKVKQLETSRELPGGENSALAKARAELNELLQKYTEKHPSVLSQSAKVKQLELEALESRVPQGNGVSSDGAAGTVTGVLTDPQFRVVLRALEQRSGVDTILAPKVITLSGRETHISIPQEGFLLKTTPTVGADEYSLQLSVDFELTLDKESGAPPARVASTVVLWDGQSVVLGGIPKEETVTENGQKVTRKKNVLLFITPTIVDPAGNRVNARP